MIAWVANVTHVRGSQTTPQSFDSYPQPISLMSSAQCLSCWCPYNIISTLSSLGLIPESFSPLSLFLNSWNCADKLLTWVSAHPFQIFQTLVLPAT